MVIKTQDLNAKLFGRVDKRKTSNKEETKLAMQEKAPFIELNVAGEEAITFVLVKIPANQIEIKTNVFEENAREQEFLTKSALSDILYTLETKGQQYPAIGRQNGNKIEVLDGSRRRQACIYAQKEFLIYVAQNVNSNHAKFLSDVANAHKSLSLYEKGKEMRNALNTGKARDQKELSNIFQCSEALVSGALKAADLPLDLLRVYPNVSEVGRPTIVKIHKIFNQLNLQEKDKVIQQIKKTKFYKLSDIETIGTTRLIKEVSIKLENIINSIRPENKKSENIGSLLSGKINYKLSNNKLAINISDINEEKAKKILMILEEHLT